MQKNEARKKLIALIRKAHAGERAAAIAYQGHQRILRSAAEREIVAGIEADEWIHRKELAAMLARLGCKPSLPREMLFLLVGWLVSLGCLICRPFLAAYFAGILEKKNVDEYAEMERFALEAGEGSYSVQFGEMGYREATHEAALLGLIKSHPMLPYAIKLFGWGGQLLSERPSRV